MGWRLAKSLEKLREEVNARWPNRSKASDGTIGDPAHSSRTSDHNPNSAGVVCAMDITHDPAHGLSSEALAEALRASRDPRIKYIISNKKIAGGEKGWDWCPYPVPPNKNPHDHHVHVSVHGSYDDTRSWSIAGVPTEPVANAPQVRPMLRKGAKGNTVGELQTALNKHGAKLTVDDDFGNATDAAVRAFQKAKGVVADGIVGPQTWGLLNG